MSLRLMMAAVCACALVAPARALAQNAGDDVSTAKIRVGPLGLTPRIAIRNMGVDTNVYKSVDAPKKDFTATFEPELDSWLRLGRAQFSGKSSVSWLYFGRTATERSLGQSEAASAELRLTHLTPSAGVTFVRTIKSASMEIDARIPQTTLTRRGGVSAALGPALSVNLDGAWTAFRVDPLGGTGVELANTLNRHTVAATASFRYIATPLTTIVVMTGIDRDRFDLTPLRNSNSVSVTPGFEFKPFALTSGTLFVGYRHFNALDPQVPDYSGPTASVSLSYVAREMTKVSISVRRDIEYSFEVTQPYYIANATELTVTQMFGPVWDGVVRLGRSSMDYKNVTTVTTGEGRRDRVNSWGIGFGHHLPSGLRVGFDIDYSRRVSVVDGRGFHGFRFGGSVTYGS